MSKNDQLLDLNTYRAIKKMSRVELSNHYNNVYMAGYNAGHKDGSAIAMDLSTIKESILKIPGIGSARAEAIMQAITDNTEIADTTSDK